MPAQGIAQALFAIFFTGCIERFGNAICVKRKCVA
jgi:hypothetical protein